MRVHYPKLHNMVHTTSFKLLLPRDQTFFYFITLQKHAHIIYRDFPAVKIEN